VESQLQAEQISAHFGKAARTYEQSARLQREVAFDALRFLPQQQQGTLLDLGCGPGWFHHNLSSYCDELIALDLSAAMLEQAERHGIARQFIQANAAQIPLPDHSVDTVFSSLMLQWCPEPAQVFAEIARVLKPGGYFVLTTLVEESMHEFQQAWHHTGQKPPILTFSPVADYLRAARANGLSCHGQQKTFQLFFPDVFTLAREFKQVGANYTGLKAGSVPGLVGRGHWQRFADAYQRNLTTQGLPLSYQVLFIFGQMP
jgi:malonyl-CoA O-methyltransferase